MKKNGNILQFATEDTDKATLSGSTLRKQIAKFGEWVNPEYPWFSDDPIMSLDEAWGATIVKNFVEDSLGSPVPVPVNHTDDSSANAGVVKSLEVVAGDGLYALVDILDEEVLAKVEKGLIFDVSISFAWDFVRQDNGKHYGATLLHVALVNTPYLIGMKSFEKVGEALSKLSKSLSPVSLSKTSDGAIMLSRTKVKELSKDMSELTNVKNENEFDVTIKVTRDEEEVEEVVKAGEEVSVPEDVAEEVKTQFEEAEAPKEEDSKDPETGEEEEDSKESEDKKEEEPEDEEDPKKEDEEEEDPKSEEESSKSELSRVKLENEEYKVKAEYSALLSKGLVIPAQEAKIVGLAKLSQGVELSTDNGKKVSLTSIVFDILKAGAVKFSTEEVGSGEEGKEDEEEEGSEDDKKPSERLSEDELNGFKAVGADVDKMDEMAAKDPVFRKALEALSKK